ncbi:MAG: tRNA (adenosine(37)-N6)-threonylcarbamoyltransferase complex ATPase subunit type 1 TsaE [Pseudomonadota bacterium]
MSPNDDAERTGPAAAATSAVARLADPAATDALGRRLAAALRPGDAVCLSGPLGAGKSALARAVIAARLAAEGRAEDAPSPTYTLAQIYETAAGEIWHVDLYRLAGAADELEELGLAEPPEDAILLIEWPDRLGALAPSRRLDIALEIPQNLSGRIVSATARGGDGWGAALRAVAAGEETTE